MSHRTKKRKMGLRELEEFSVNEIFKKEKNENNLTFFEEVVDFLRSAGYNFFKWLFA